MTTIATPLLPFPVSICGIPELSRYQGRQVTHVLSLMDPGYPEPGAFAELRPAWRRMLWFHDIIGPVDGMTGPEPRDVERILDLGRELRNEAVDHLLIHCHMGVSRSTATAAILMAQFNPGREEEVYQSLRQIRPQSWPNSLMIAIADTLLYRNGALVGHLRIHHHFTARQFPQFASLIWQVGRGHEMPEE